MNSPILAELSQRATLLTHKQQVSADMEGDPASQLSRWEEGGDELK